MNYYLTNTGKILRSKSLISNPNVMKVEKPKTYEILYNAFGLMVEKNIRPQGTEYKVSRGLTSFTTSVNPFEFNPINKREVLNTMIEDYITDSNDDYSADILSLLD